MVEEAPGEAAATAEEETREVPAKVEKKEAAEEEADEDEDTGPSYWELPVTGKRERKQVERLLPKEQAKKELKIVKGAGTALKDIPNVMFEMKKRTRKDKLLKDLHRFCFKQIAKEATLKSNLGEFSGVVYSDKDKERELLADKIAALQNTQLAELGVLLDLPAPKSGTKDEKVEKILSFLEKPTASGGRMKDTPKRKKKAKTKGKAKAIRGPTKKSKAQADDDGDEEDDEGEEEKEAPKPKKAKKSPVVDDDDDDDDVPLIQVVKPKEPTEKDLEKSIRAILKKMDLKEVTVRKIRELLAEEFKCSMDERKSFIKQCVVRCANE